MCDTPFARGHLGPRYLTAESGCIAFLVAVTMSIKLSAGSGYDYLTRQVAAFDATAKGHIGLASYYAERGESPGAWIGSGMAGIDGLQAGEPVSAEQMWALFGVGMHPLATQRLQQLCPTSSWRMRTFERRPGSARRSRLWTPALIDFRSRWPADSLSVPALCLLLIRGIFGPK